MKKQIFVIALICLIVIIVGAGIYYFYYKKPVDEVNNLNLKSEPAKPAAKTLYQIFNSADNSACAGLASEADKNACRLSYIIKDAAQSGDLSKCDATTDKASAEICLAQASFSLAIKKKDKKYCDNIINKSDKESCFKAVADMLVK